MENYNGFKLAKDGAINPLSFFRTFSTIPPPCFAEHIGSLKFQEELSSPFPDIIHYLLLHGHGVGCDYLTGYGNLLQ